MANLRLRATSASLVSALSAIRNITKPASTATSRPFGRFFNGRDRFPVETVQNMKVERPRLMLDTSDGPYTAAESTVFAVTNANNGGPGSFDTAYFAAIQNKGGDIQIDPGLDLGSRELYNRGGSPHDPTQGWIRIRTKPTATGRTAPLAGEYGTPTTGATAARFTSPSGDGNLALRIRNGAYKIRVIDCAAIQHENQAFATSLISTEPDSDWIILDRMYVSPNSYEERMCVRGVDSASNRFALLDSHVGDFRKADSDGQGLAIRTCLYGWKCVGTYLGGGAEPFMTGGGEPEFQYRPEYYPKDGEFRRCHVRVPMRWNPHSVYFRDSGQVLLDNLTVGAILNDSTYQPANVKAGWRIGEITLKLAPGQFFNTAHQYNERDQSNAWLTFCEIVSGPGAGGWGMFYGNDYSESVAGQGYDTIRLIAASYYGGRWKNGSPAAGSVIRVKRAPRIFTKNLWELKTQERLYFSEVVGEHHWFGFDNQQYCMIPKVTDNGAYTNTINITLYDFAMVGVSGGIGTASYNVEPGRQPYRNCHSLDIDNFLIISTQTPFASRNTGYSIDSALTTVSRGAFYPLAGTRAFMEPLGANGSGDIYAKFPGTTFDRIIGAVGEFMVIQPTDDARASFQLRYSSDFHWKVTVYNCSGYKLDQNRWVQPGDFTDSTNRTRLIAGDGSPMAPPPVANAVYTGDWQTGDWTAVGAAAGDGPDWNDLKTRLNGVRRSYIPFEWGVD